jgi:hypothetical protein
MYPDEDRYSFPGTVVRVSVLIQDYATALLFRCIYVLADCHAIG